MMLVTTSRKPGQLTRSMARTLARLLGVPFVNRGKAGFSQVLAKAKKEGLSRVLFVWEKNGNPARLVFFEEEWLKPEIQVNGVVLERVAFREEGCKIKAEDEFGRKIAKLFEHAEGPNKILLSSEGLKGFHEDKLVLELRFH